MKDKIRLLVVDDNSDIHDVIRILLKDKNDIELIGQAYDGDSALKLCKLAKPDLVLMDVVLPGMNGFEVTEAILQILPNTKILALSSYHEHEYIRKMLDSGATGYLVKDAISQDLLTTNRNTMQGNTVLSPQVAKAIFTSEKNESDTLDFGLTQRELEVLKRMAEGHTYSAIAYLLQISSPTVRFHVSNILEKMAVETRSEALVLAAKNQLI
jgi:DNA-binding NarL/FixJ family response regulator